MALLKPIFKTTNFTSLTACRVECIYKTHLNKRGLFSLGIVLCSLNFKAFGLLYILVLDMNGYKKKR